MPSIILQRFGGLAPRISARMLRNGNATVATSTKLWYGELRPFSSASTIPVPTGLPDDAAVRTIYLLVNKWLAWTKDVDVAQGFTALSASGQIYITGDGIPKQTNITAVADGPTTPTALFKLGVAGPTTPLHAQDLEEGVDTAARAYVYTYYTKFNEESVPSDPSNIVTVGNGGSVTLSGFDTNYPENVVQVRIYRTFNNEFHLAHSYFTDAPPDPLLINDQLDDEELAEPLISQHYYPPPEDMQGVIGLACGSLAGFHENRVVFSEPYQPGAWPPEYEKIFDANVVGLGTFGQTTVVATGGYTYLVFGSHPRTFAVARIPDPYPCVSKRSIASVDNGVVYASRDGLIFVGSAGVTTGSSLSSGTGVHLLTRMLMTQKEWVKYAPHTIMGVVSEGKYFGFYQPDPVKKGAGFIYDFSAKEEALITGVTVDEQKEFSDDILVDNPVFASAAYANPYTPLCYVEQKYPITVPVGNTLRQWEGTELSQIYDKYVWRSKQFSFPYAVTFSVAKFIFNNEFPRDASFAFRIYDGAKKTLLYHRIVTTDEPFRLPELRGRTEWMVEVEGTSFLQMIQMSTSYAELVERGSTEAKAAA